MNELVQAQEQLSSITHKIIYLVVIGTGVLFLSILALVARMSKGFRKWDRLIVVLAVMAFGVFLTGIGFWITDASEVHRLEDLIDKLNNKGGSTCPKR